MLRLMTLAKYYKVKYDSVKALNRRVDFTGPGWYSMNDRKVYRKGRFPTHSRILIQGCRLEDNK